MALFDDFGIDWATGKKKKEHEAVPVETDKELKERLVYVAGDTREVIARISMLAGEDLDDLAYCYGLKRRGT